MDSYNDDTSMIVANIQNRRLRKELEFHLLDMHRDKQIFKDVEPSVVIEYGQNFAKFIINTSTKLVTVMAKIHDGYPWRKPIIYLNDKPYDSILHVPPKFLKKIGIHYECMCCQSILCDWNPMRSLHNVLDEITHNLELRTRVVHYIFCEKSLKNIFEGDAFGDVQTYILTFI